MTVWQFNPVKYVCAIDEFVPSIDAHLSKAVSDRSVLINSIEIDMPVAYRWSLPDTSGRFSAPSRLVSSLSSRRAKSGVLAGTACRCKWHALIRKVERRSAYHQRGDFCGTSLC